MARLLSAQYSDPVFAGEYGNYSIKAGHIIAVVASGATDTIDWFVIPGKSRIHDWRLFSKNGSTANMGLGWRYVDGSAGGGAAVMVAPGVLTAGTPFGPAALGEVIDIDKDVIIFSTLSVALAAGNRADCRVEYEFRGTL